MTQTNPLTITVKKSGNGFGGIAMYAADGHDLFFTEGDNLNGNHIRSAQAVAAGRTQTDGKASLRKLSACGLARGREGRSTKLLHVNALADRRSDNGVRRPDQIKDKAPEVIACNLVNGDIKQIARQMRQTANLRPDVKKPVQHHVLSRPFSTIPKPGELEKIVRQYTAERGIDAHQWIAIAHQEGTKDDPRFAIHLIFNRVAQDCHLWDDRRSGALAQKAARKIATDLRLDGHDRPTPRREDQPTARVPSKNEIEKFQRTGLPIPRTGLQNSIAAARFQSVDIPTFEAALSSAGVDFRRYERDGKLAGYSFSQDGIKFKGSQIDRAFTPMRLNQWWSQQPVVASRYAQGVNKRGEPQLCQTAPNTFH